MAIMSAFQAEDVGSIPITRSSNTVTTYCDLMGITEILIEYITQFIALTGYVGIFLLMTLESMIAPVPSEGVMPFAGFLISDGQLTWIGVLIASTLGSLAGSLASYYMGRYLGEPFILKFGKYLLLNKEHLESTEKFFAKYGQGTVFISRFIPVVRHFISIPAGIAKMSISKFLLYTVVGATLWNMFLAYVGFRLRDNWNTIKHYSEWLDIVVLAAILFAVVYFITKQLKKRKKA